MLLWAPTVCLFNSVINIPILWVLLEPHLGLPSYPAMYCQLPQIPWPFRLGNCVPSSVALTQCSDSHYEAKGALDSQADIETLDCFLPTKTHNVFIIIIIMVRWGMFVVYPDSDNLDNMAWDLYGFN